MPKNKNYGNAVIKQSTTVAESLLLCTSGIQLNLFEAEAPQSVPNSPVRLKQPNLNLDSVH